MAFSRIRLRKRRRQAQRSRNMNYAVNKMNEIAAKWRGIPLKVQQERHRKLRQEWRDYFESVRKSRTRNNGLDL